MVALFITAALAAATPSPFDYDTLVREMRAKARAAKFEEINQNRWLCAGVDERQRIVVRPGHQGFDQAEMKIVEAKSGLRLIYQDRSGKNTLCLPQKEIFGAKLDKDFARDAASLFEDARLPASTEFKGTWTCAYAVKTALKFFPAPVIGVRGGGVYIDRFFGETRARLSQEDRAWRISREDGEYQAVYRLWRAEEGVRLLQESTGVDPEAVGTKVTAKRRETTHAVCVPAEELTERFFGEGSGAPSPSRKPRVR